MSTKKASKSGQDGSIGQTRVKLMFEELGWGPVPNLEHDSGTDLFVQVRDTDLTELGLLLGVQVKNEKKYATKKLTTGPTGVSGWWYSARPADVMLWLKHAVPHVLALYNSGLRVAYWGVVEADNVKWSKKGAKIFVPQTQLIDEDGKAALLAVASSARARSWAGSTWTDGEEIPPADRLRTAILTPRIFAKHGNRSFTSLTAEQGIAGLMLCRDDAPSDAGAFSDVVPVPQRKGSQWRWNLYDALRSYVIDGAGVDSLRQILDSAPGTEDRTAAAALIAGFLRECGQLPDTTGLLDALPEPEGSIDKAWLNVHRAAADFELGRRVSARERALEVMTLQATHSDDPTALVLVAAAAEIAFQTGPTVPGELESTIRATDTPPIWWQTQYRAWGLSFYLDGAFKRWAGKPSDGTYERGQSVRYLRAVALQHAASGNHPVWKQSVAELVEAELVAGDDVKEVVYEGHLRDLILSGDKDRLHETAQQAIRNGPAAAVKRVAEEVHLEVCTRSSLRTSVELVGLSACLINQADADRFAGWALNVIANPEQLSIVPDRWYWTVLEAIDMLTRLIPAVSPGQLEAIRRFMTKLPPVDDQSKAHRLAGLFAAIPKDSWTPGELEELTNRLDDVGPNWTWAKGAGEQTPFGDNWEFSNATYAVLSRNREHQRERVLEGMGEGKLLAFVGQRIDDLPATVAQSAVAHLAEQVIGEVNEFAQTGGWAMRVVDPGGLLVQLNVLYPDLADWLPVHRVLSEPAVQEQVAQILRAVGDSGTRIAPDIAEELTASIQNLPTAGYLPGLFGDLPKLRRRALDALDTEPLAPAKLWNLLERGVEGKRVVAMKLGRQPQASQVGLLQALVTDSDPDVSANAVWAATRWAVVDVERETVLKMIMAALESTGTEHARAVTVALFDDDGADRALDPLRETLASIPTGAVR